MKNKIFVGAVVAIVAVIAIFAIFMRPAHTPETDGPATSAQPDPATFVRSHSPSFGNSLARVTVVEWLDPECESCRIVHPMVKSLVSEYSDRVRFVIRYMPYHQNSMYAASALEETKEFQKYNEALDVLFEKQPEWGDHHNPRPELIAEYLSALGIPKDKLEPNYVIEKHGEKIKQDEADGNAVGVRGTPTFFVNGKMVYRLGYEPLKEAIEQALAASK